MGTINSRPIVLFWVLDSDSEPHGILEVTQSGAKDPSKLEFEGRRQELGLTSGFIRYWKDGKDIEQMMEQANNFLLLNYPDCFDLVRSPSHFFDFDQ